MFDEKEILEFWEKNNVFEKSVEKNKPVQKEAGRKTFVFFEGPPTANGKPHIGHFETRVFKDVVLRYKTMRGFYSPRRAGWDTHGLPVEVEVEKSLGLKSKKEIEAYGVAAFNKKCKESVWQYKSLWEEFTKRMGFWIDMGRPYITYENAYIENLWGVIKKFDEKKLLYEDYRVLPWCARCGTALSSHELAQGYEKVKENSVYVKFKMKGEPDTYFLVWTTTPWTLPGNVALAVNPAVDYAEVMPEDGREKLILADARLQFLNQKYKLIAKRKGKDLVGTEYEPLYKSEAPYKVVAGDFVSTDDGTGIVHIAPAFGEDDFQLSKKFDLPVLATAGQDGLMKTSGYAWDGAWFKKADRLITEDLKSRKLLFKEEAYEHDYPFCWRCKNPLMYLARKSWWVDVNKVRGDLLDNNKKISWHPEHIKEGRFGEWLKEKKNWSFSRERYWGTPLPVWRCDERGGGCGHWEVIGSLAALNKRSASSGNRYFAMRHGEAENNAKKIINSNLQENHYQLTPKGRRDAELTAKTLLKKGVKPDLIFTSPFLRARQTAGLVAGIFGVSEENIKIDPRLAEVGTGIFSGGRIEKYYEYFKDQAEKFVKAPPEGETLTEVKKRVFGAIAEMENRYQNKTIFIVSHEDTLWMLWAALGGKTDEETVFERQVARKGVFLKTGECAELKFCSLPRDENLILDLHKPFADEIVIQCKCGGQMRRVPEVCDVWFDSGAMPFASNPPGFPADYIVEAIDQTRGWFYTLLAVSTLLGKGEPYKNVISLGHVMDSKGKKMSKSLGNVVEPMALIGKYGADAARWYFLTINQPWDSKLFKDEDVKDVSRRFFVILWNVLQFWKMYGESPKLKVQNPKLLINQWVLAKLSETAGQISGKLDSYDIIGAARDLENFAVEDVSRWYVRRIRDVMKEGSGASSETAAVLARVLAEIAKLLAPFAPFMAEKIWMELGRKTSVHLEDWPEAAKLTDVKSLEDMWIVRQYVNFALKLRQTHNIKVRQPLQFLTISDKHQSLSDDYLSLLKEEINVKEIKFMKASPSSVIDASLDTAITPELKEEGILRDLVREIQSARKKAGLMPKDKVQARLELPKEVLEIAEKNKKTIEKETYLKVTFFSESAEIKISLD